MGCGKWRLHGSLISVNFPGTEIGVIDVRQSLHRPRVVQAVMHIQVYRYTGAGEWARGVPGRQEK